jgi:type VI secretion system protein ImpA
MPSPEVLDFDAMLAPISDDAYSGHALRGGEPEQRAVFQQVKDAREICRSAERQMLNSWGSDDAAEVESPDWSIVKSSAIEVLSNHSKDLWVAAWLLEALIREDGFAGLRDGFRYVREMVDKFFEYGIHPQPDEEMGEDPSDTTAQLTGLFDGALSPAIDKIPIALDDYGSGLTSGDWKMSAELEKIADPAAKQARIEEGTLPLSKFESYARHNTSADFLKANYEDAQAALDEFKQLAATLDEKFGYDHAPPTTTLRETLEDCLDRMRSFSKHVIDTDDATETPEQGAMATTAGAGGQMVGGGAASGRVATRDDAFKVLDQVADFFERTEPHSLIPFALKQIVGWGKMSLPELLKELINDETVLNDLNKRTGVPRIEDPSAEEY